MCRRLLLLACVWLLASPALAQIPVDSELAAAAAAADTFANPTTAPTLSFLMRWNGTTWDRWDGVVTATNLDVQSGGADLATTTQAADIQTAVELIDDAIVVDDADVTNDTSKGVMMACWYESAPSTATDGDAALVHCDANGALSVQGGVTVTGTVTLPTQPDWVPTARCEDPDGLSIVNIDEAAGTGYRAIVGPTAGSRYWVCRLQVTFGGNTQFTVAFGTGADCVTTATVQGTFDLDSAENALSYQAHPYQYFGAADADQGLCIGTVASVTFEGTLLVYAESEP